MEQTKRRCGVPVTLYLRDLHEDIQTEIIATQKHIAQDEHSHPVQRQGAKNFLWALENGDDVTVGKIWSSADVALFASGRAQEVQQ